MRETVVVVGGGLAGLWIARTLTGSDRVVMCLEARDACGGRVRSAYDGDGALLYETGPWRVPETHRRVLALFREHSVPLSPLRTPTLPSTHATKVIPGLSTWDVHALTHGPETADAMDRRTGYADQTHSASGSAPYATSASRYFVAPDGFSSLIDRLAEGVDVRVHHRVVDVRSVDGGYAVRISRRTGHNAFEEEVVHADALFVCVPPGQCMEWDVFATHARSVMHAVEPGELHHVYVERKVPEGAHRRDGGSLLSQSISSQYCNRWFQAAYCGGRVARFWHHLRLSDVASFRDVLGRELRRMWGSWATLRRDDEVRSHFWPAAFHRWRAVPGFELQSAVVRAVCPSPRLPRVYLAGEAFSSYQAWMEGALETARLAVDVFLKSHPGARPPSRAEFVVVEGHEIDVERWAAVHPGGRHAIANHVGEDVTSLMRQFGHSPHAWAVVHSLKRRTS